MKKLILTATVFMAMAMPVLADTIKGEVWVNVIASQSLSVKTGEGLKVIRYIPSKTCVPEFYKSNDIVKVDYHFDAKTKSNIADNIEILKEASSNSINKPSDTITKADFLSAVDKGEALIVDVRGLPKFKEGAFKGAKNIPLWTLEHRLAELPKDKQIIIYCSSGKMSRVAADLLKEKGFTDVKFLRMGVQSGNGEAKIVAGKKVKC